MDLPDRTEAPARGELVARLGAIPTGVRLGVEGFWREYLGEAGERVPFGGRAAELSALDAWLASGEVACALVVAGAGRGKSALLAQWAERVARRGEADVVVVPFSIRFGTALRTAGLSMLSAVCQGRPEAAGSLGDIVAALRGDRAEGERPLLLVIDALDEAIDWSPWQALELGAGLGRGVKVLVSARALADCDAAGWQARLGWAGRCVSLALPPLGRGDLSEALEGMGQPLSHLPEQVLLLDELVRLTEGDPLLLRLYVEALRGQGERLAFLYPEDLWALQPGLGGYLDRWWHEQRRQWGSSAPLEEPLVRGVLGLLASALGPLTADDLLALLEPEGATRESLRRAMAPLGRFVLGHLDDRRGFVFSHPRLAQHTLESLPAAERAAWAGRLVRWGVEAVERLRSGRIEPAAVPAYLIQHHGAQLDLHGADDASLFALVSDPWRRAWELFSGGVSGFLLDVERAWRRADQAFERATTGEQRLEAMRQQVRCALAHDVLDHIAQRIPAELRTALVREGVWTPAAALHASRDLPPASLLPLLPDTHVWEVVARVRAAAGSNPDAELLRDLGVRLVAMGFAREAEHLLASCLPYGPWSPLEAIAPALPHDRALASLAAALEVIGSDASHDPGAFSLACALVSRLDPEAQGKTLDDLTQWLHKKASAGDTDSWCKLACAYARGGLFEALFEAIPAASLVGCGGLLPLLPEPWRARLGERLLASLPRSLRKDSAGTLEALARYWPEHAEECLRRVRAVRSQEVRCSLLWMLGGVLPRDSAAPVFAEALALVRPVYGRSEEAITLCRRLGLLPDTSLVTDEQRQTIYERFGPASESRPWIALGLSRLWPDDKVSEGFHALLPALQTGLERQSLPDLLALWRRLPAHEQPAVASQILDIAERCDLALWEIRGWQDLAPAEVRQAWLVRALGRHRSLAPGWALVSFLAMASARLSAPASRRLASLSLAQARLTRDDARGPALVAAAGAAEPGARAALVREAIGLISSQSMALDLLALAEGEQRTEVAFGWLEARRSRDLGSLYSDSMPLIASLPAPERKTELLNVLDGDFPSGGHGWLEHVGDAIRDGLVPREFGAEIVRERIEQAEPDDASLRLWLARFLEPGPRRDEILDALLAPLLASLPWNKTSREWLQQLVQHLSLAQLRALRGPLETQSDSAKNVARIARLWECWFHRLEDLGAFDEARAQAASLRAVLRAAIPPGVESPAARTLQWLERHDARLALQAALARPDAPGDRSLDEAIEATIAAEGDAGRVMQALWSAGRRARALSVLPSLEGDSRLWWWSEVRPSLSEAEKKPLVDSIAQAFDAWLSSAPELTFDYLEHCRLVRPPLDAELRGVWMHLASASSPRAARAALLESTMVDLRGYGCGPEPSEHRHLIGQMLDLIASLAGEPAVIEVAETLVEIRAWFSRAPS